MIELDICLYYNIIVLKRQVSLIGGDYVAKSKLVKVNQKIADTVAQSYKKVENTVVKGYKKVVILKLKISL